jgi:Leucine-rich repeat (LRR) protein
MTAVAFPGFKTPCNYESKFPIKQLPPDLILNIFSSFPESNSLIKSLGNLRSTCLGFKEITTKQQNLDSITRSFFSKNAGEPFHLDLMKILGCQNFDDPRLTSILNKVENLNLSGSDIDTEQLKNLLDHCWNLKILNLDGCQNLQEIPDLSKLTNLEILILSSSENLEKLPDLSNLTKLRVLDLSFCARLQTLNLSGLKNLNTLDLTHCECLINLPDLKEQDKLETLILRNCINLEELPALSSLTELRVLDLKGCSILEEQGYCTLQI